MVTVKDVIKSLEGDEKNSAKAYFKKLKKVKEIKLKKRIKDEQNHTTLVNLTAHPFFIDSNLSDSGYKFICVDPLVYLNEKNFDVFLYNEKTKKAILLECRAGSFVEPTLVEETKEKINIAEKNKQNLEQIVGNIEGIEYVLVVRAIRKDEVVKMVKESNMADRICVWSTDQMSGIVKLAHGKHENNVLNSKLSDNGLDCRNFNINIEFLPSSNCALIMEKIVTYLVSRMREDNNEVFSRSEMCELLKTFLSNYPDDAIRGYADSFIGIGLEYEIFVSIGDRVEAKYALNVSASFGRQGEKAKEICIKRLVDKETSKEFLKNYESKAKALESKQKIAKEPQKTAGLDKFLEKEGKSEGEK